MPVLWVVSFNYTKFYYTRSLVKLILNTKKKTHYWQIFRLLTDLQLTLIFSRPDSFYTASNRAFWVWTSSEEEPCSTPGWMVVFWTLASTQFSRASFGAFSCRQSRTF